MDNILITGAAGFIGYSACEYYIGKGYNVFGVDNLRFGYRNPEEILGNRFYKRDVNEFSIDEIPVKIDSIIHLAAISSLAHCQSFPIEALDANIKSLYTILEQIRDYKSEIKFVFASTSAVYENNKTNEPFTEELRIEPDLVYSNNKATGEAIVKSYASNYGINASVARFFNVYGSNQDLERKIPPFLGYLARETYFKRTPVLYNSSDIKRDYVHIDDVLKAITEMLLKDSVECEIYNICSGIGYSVPDLVKMYSKVCNYNINPEFKEANTFWEKYNSELYDRNKPFSRRRLEKEVYKSSIGSNKKIIDSLGVSFNMTMEKGLESIKSATENFYAK